MGAVSRLSTGLRKNYSDKKPKLKFGAVTKTKRYSLDWRGDLYRAFEGAPSLKIKPFTYNQQRVGRIGDMRGEYGEFTINNLILHNGRFYFEGKNKRGEFIHLMPELHGPKGEILSYKEYSKKYGVLGPKGKVAVELKEVSTPTMHYVMPTQARKEQVKSGDFLSDRFGNPLKGKGGQEITSTLKKDKRMRQMLEAMYKLAGKMPTSKEIVFAKK